MEVLNKISKMVEEGTITEEHAQKVLYKMIEDSGMVQKFNKKIGRNEKCPCGSTKKYKKCHGSLTRTDSLLGHNKATEKTKEEPSTNSLLVQQLSQGEEQKKESVDIIKEETRITLDISPAPIWCLHPDCLTECEPFENLEQLRQHEKAKHA
jgi:hypothetical protein